MPPLVIHGIHDLTSERFKTAAVSSDTLPEKCDQSGCERSYPSFRMTPCETRTALFDLMLASRSPVWSLFWLNLVCCYLSAC